jgi:hypothetical protein
MLADGGGGVRESAWTSSRARVSYRHSAGRGFRDLPARPRHGGPISLTYGGSNRDYHKRARTVYDRLRGRDVGNEGGRHVGGGPMMTAAGDSSCEALGHLEALEGGTSSGLGCHRDGGPRPLAVLRAGGVIAFATELAYWLMSLCASSELWPP